MHDNPFTDEELAARVAAFRRIVAAKALDLALVSSAENIFYLTGLDHWGYFAPHVLIVPAVGEMVMTKTFTDQGPESAGSPIHKIDLKTEVSHQSAEGSPLEMKISGQKGTGLYKFDAQAGRVVSARVEDSMTMSLSAGGRRIEQTTSNTITTELAPAADSSAK